MGLHLIRLDLDSRYFRTNLRWTYGCKRENATGWRKLRLEGLYNFTLHQVLLSIIKTNRIIWVVLVARML